MTKFVPAFFAALLLSTFLPAKAQDLPREEIEQIVRDYLLREPEVIYEAIQEYQRRQQVAEDEKRKEALASKGAEIFEDARDPVSNTAGDVVLVEFFDYRCGYCRSMADGLESLVTDDNKLRFVYKEYPILGEDSVRAAHAALAAAMQDAYEPMHFALMRARDLSENGIRSIASTLNLDVEKLIADMASDEITQHLNDNIALARSLGINGTPSFVFTDQVIPGAVPVEQLVEMIQERRDAS